MGFETDDDGPLTFDVTWRVDGMHCAVRDGTGRHLAERGFYGVLFGVMCLASVHHALDGERRELDNWLTSPVALLSILVGLAIWYGVKHQRTGELLHGPVLLGLSGVLALLLHNQPFGVFWGALAMLQVVYAAVLAAHFALTRMRPTHLDLTAHAVRIDGGPPMALENLALALDGRHLVVGAHRIGMGAHQPWERDWLLRRLQRQRVRAGLGGDRTAARDAVERLRSETAAQDSSDG